MNRPDDLQHLWQTQPVDPAMKGEEMRKIVLQKMEKFDRIIKWRNRSESVAALAVAAFFAYAAWIAPNGIARLGSAIIVGGALWIVYYIRKHGTEPADPNPDQTLAGYQTALARKYDHQIRLLRNVKFWYLLPMYIGLLTLSAGLVAQKGAFTWTDAFGPLSYTLVFAGVWWLNEVYTVRKLQRRRARLISGMEGDTADV